MKYRRKTFQYEKNNTIRHLFPHEANIFNVRQLWDAVVNYER